VPGQRHRVVGAGLGIVVDGSQGHQAVLACGIVFNFVGHEAHNKAFEVAFQSKAVVELDFAAKHSGILPPQRIFLVDVLLDLQRGFLELFEQFAAVLVLDVLFPDAFVSVEFLLHLQPPIVEFLLPCNFLLVRLDQFLFSPKEVHLAAGGLLLLPVVLFLELVHFSDQFLDIDWLVFGLAGWLLDPEGLLALVLSLNLFIFMHFGLE
jgi:hypothetical protein